MNRGPCALRYPGFTLVELLVSLAILSIIVVTMLSLLNLTQHLWRSTNSSIEEYRAARNGFEAMTRQLSQATLNTYWDYVRNPAGVPQSYGRQSELRFLSGPSVAGSTASNPPRPSHAVFFQAPIGFVADPTYTNLNTLVNTWGYYVEFASDQAARPTFITAPPRYRMRLMELMEPSESANSVYVFSSGNSTYNGTDWITQPLLANPTHAHMLADNVVALVVLPMLAPADEQSLGLSGPIGTNLAPKYTYDSTTTNGNVNLDPKNQLPPVVQVTMVAIDEPSATRLAAINGTSLPPLHLDTLFQVASQYNADLTSLEQTLQTQHVGFRVYTVAVGMRGAKWSTNQSN